MRKGFLTNYMIHLGTFEIVKMKRRRGESDMEKDLKVLNCQAFTILN